MSDPPLGRWAPLGVPQVGDLFCRASFRWWISGGRALELHVGRSWRDHGDTDIGIRRTDVAALVAALPGWELHIAARGRLSRWRGEALDPALGQNNLWCRRPGGPWELDVALGEGDDEAWVYRRDPGVRIAWADAVLHTAEGVPYLAPEAAAAVQERAPSGEGHGRCSRGDPPARPLASSPVVPPPARRPPLAGRADGGLTRSRERARRHSSQVKGPARSG